MSVGQELLDVPLPSMVARLGMGVADAQHALDMNSVETAEILAETKVEIVPEITREITDSGVNYTEADTVELSLLQVGLNPTFYQFSEATIEVEMDIKTTSERETEVGVKTKAKAKAPFGLWSASIQAEFKHNRKFGKEVHGTSRLKTKMVPVPPPERIMPEVKTVDLRSSSEDET